MITFILCLFQWQQSVSYRIEAYLDTADHSLRGVEYLTYYNNSPYRLDTLYIHLYPNAYKDENTVFMKEMKQLSPHDYEKLKKKERGYIDIDCVLINGDSASFLINGTLLTIPLFTPLNPHDSLVLKLGFYLKIPQQISRLGYQDEHYEMTQWYPKMCVFDRSGWHCDTYHAIGEFYGEYGTFDVEIDLPAGYVVAATGERITPGDRQFIDSLIISKRKPHLGERKKVRFLARDVHDFAWVCDPEFLVERYNVDGIDIYIFFLKEHEKDWRNAGLYAVDAVERYNRWYGKYPYKNLSVVEGYFGGGMEYPNLVLIGHKENRFVRSFEIVIVHEIAHQWFYGILGSNEMDEAWLDEGFTTFTELRYLEDKYGKDGSIIKSSLIPPLTRRYFHKLIYYISQSNAIEKSIITPAYDYLDVPLAYANAAYSKPALFLYNLQGIIGGKTFDKILKRYCKEYRFKHPTSSDFLRICQEETGRDFEPLFSGFLTTTYFCDWAVKKVTANTVEIENRGAIQSPVDVLVETEAGEDIFRIDTEEKIYTITLPVEQGKIKKVVIDPDGYSLEPNHWNNYYPPRIQLKPFFALPSFDTYQIIFSPYLWYGSDDGFIPGLYLFGGRFIDYDFLKGEHQWLAGCTYGLKSKNFYPSIRYQTPVFFKQGKRIRLKLHGSKPNGMDKLEAGFVTNLGLPYSSTPQIEIKNMFSYTYLYSYIAVDSNDWDTGKNFIFDNSLEFEYRNWRVNLGAAVARQIYGGEWSYLRTTLEIEKKTAIFIPFKIRIFAGRVFGDAPTQERLFLSGALRISMLADLLFSQSGYFSPQEHIHISGDGNMRGYQTMHIKSNELYCLNLEFPFNCPIRVFADFGYYGEFVFDVGASLVLGPVSFNLPFYILSDEEWKIRWSIGF